MAVILKNPPADVCVADGAVWPLLVERSVSVAPDSVSADVVEAMVRERLAEAGRARAVEFQQEQSRMRQEVDAERTAVEAERAALASASAAVERAAAELAGLRRRVLAEAERQVLELAVEMARTVLRQEVDAGRHDPAPIVQAALAQLPPRAEVTVRLHPSDFARYGSAAAGEGRLRVLADATVPAAGCRVECGQGVVEADPQRQLDEIRQTLLTEETVDCRP